jgi:hypothetical protein
LRARARFPAVGGYTNADETKRNNEVP